MSEKAKGRKQKAEGNFSALWTAVILSVSAFAFSFVGSGCTEKSSPASTSQAVGESTVKDAAPKTVDAKLEQPIEVRKQPLRDISFDTIKFEMKKEDPFQRSMITPAIEKLADSKIRIRGYILPSFQQTGLTQFVLVRDNMQCCFGPGAALYDCIVIDMDEGKTAEFTNQPVAVDGVFGINEVRGSDDKCLAIYHLQADRVQ